MTWLRVASVLGFLGVAFGAFGAHGLRGKVPDNFLAAWQTGVLYHLLHAVVILALALYARSLESRGSAASRSSVVTVPAALFLAGIVLFSGSLYAMTLTGASRLGMITPLGGVSFLAGWVALLLKLGRAPATE